MFFNRKFVCERLRLELRQSYRMISPSRTHLISGDELLELVNDARRGIREPFLIVPSDLRTPEEMVSELGGCLTVKKLLAMSRTRRLSKVPPHFRFNKHVTRFSSSLLLEWLRANSKSRNAL